MSGIVTHSADIDRVLALPRREWSRESAKALAVWLTAQLITERGRAAGWQLLPQQAIALWEFYENWTNYRVGFFGALPVGSGKALAHGEPVFTPKGYRPIETLVVGDEVFGSAGVPIKVKGVYPQGLREVYRVTFSDGESVLCDASHLWTFRTPGGGAGPKCYWHTKTTADWAAERLQRPCGTHKAYRVFAPMIQPANLAKKDLPLDPYTLGALLGDGGLAQATISFTSMDQDIIDALILPEGIKLVKNKHQNSGRATQYNLTRGMGRQLGGTLQELNQIIKKLGLRGASSSTKFIPHDYLLGSIEQRLAILQGLCDTDGHHAHRGTVEYCTMSHELANGVAQLVHSLGGTATRGVGQTGSHRVLLRLPAQLIPFRCQRKRESYESDIAKAQRPPYRAVARIERAGSAECTCISVDAADGLFATRGFVLTHNTLIFWLAAYMIGAKRPMLFVPANLRDVEVPRMFAEYRQFWASPSPAPTVEGYSLLSQESELYVLENRQPDFMGLDEVDVCRNYTNTASKRIGGYVDVAREACAVLGMTGTPKRKSIYDNSHIIKWCLRHRAPAAISTDTLADWASAYDSDAELPLRPGALLAFADQTDVPHQFEGITSIGEQGRAREGYRRRQSQTPGFLVWDESSCDTPIHIYLVAPPDDPILDQSFEAFRTTDQTPDGWPLNEAIEKWTHERQRGCGFFYYWDPRPPEYWLVARYMAAIFCRDQIKATANRPRVRGGKNGPLDTEKAVYKAFPNQPELVEWKRIESEPGGFKPNTVAGWISGSVVWAAVNMAKHMTGTEAALIWCIHEEMAIAIGQAGGFDVYGAGGLRLDAQGRSIPDASIKAYHDSTPIPQLKTIVLTFKANYRGRNLYNYHNAICVGWEPSAEYVEQGYLGRMHRQNQTRACNVWVICTSMVTLNALEATLCEARGVLAEFGLTQKILTANIDRSGIAALPPSSRWARPEKE